VKAVATVTTGIMGRVGRVGRVGAMISYREASLVMEERVLGREQREEVCVWEEVGMTRMNPKVVWSVRTRWRCRPRSVPEQGGGGGKCGETHQPYEAWEKLAPPRRWTSRR
jgi:hypothetical protein